MSGRPAHLPPALGRVFTREDATRYGVGSRRLRQADLERIACGVYRQRAAMADLSEEDLHAGERWRRRQCALAEDLRHSMPRGSFLVGRSAAALWNLPSPDAEHESLEIGFKKGEHHPTRRTGFLAREISPHLVELAEHRGLSLTTPAVTWAMLAPLLSFRDGVALGDAIIRKARIPGTNRLERPQLASQAALESATMMGRRHGVGRLREMLPLLREESASVPETHLRLLLQEWGVPAMKLDHDVYDQNGMLVGCSEIAFPAFKLALEYESRHHLVDRTQWNRDIEKYRHYAQLGWEAIRVTSDLLYRRPETLRFQVCEALRRRGWVF